MTRLDAYNPFEDDAQSANEMRDNVVQSPATVSLPMDLFEEEVAKSQAAEESRNHESSQPDEQDQQSANFANDRIRPDQYQAGQFPSAAFDQVGQQPYSQPYPQQPVMVDPQTGQVIAPISAHSARQFSNGDPSQPLVQNTQPIPAGAVAATQPQAARQPGGMPSGMPQSQSQARPQPQSAWQSARTPRHVGVQPGINSQPAASPYQPKTAPVPTAQQPQMLVVPVAGGVNPVSKPSASKHADQMYEKGARRGGAWRVVFIIALVVLVAALSAVGYIMYTYWNGQNQYDELTQYMEVDDNDGVITLGSFNVDWDALRAINPDVVGWVYLPGTIINYPICWRENDDQYYLKRNFGDNSTGDFGAEYGCIMLSGQNNPDWTDQINVIYGHNMYNGSMFAELANNTDPAHLEAHKYFYLLTPEGNYRLEAFAVNKVLGSSTDIVIPNFPTEQEFREYVQKRFDQSLVDVQDTKSPSAIKKVFAFSTCSLPDRQYRIITFCCVDDYLAAGKDATLGKTEVDAGVIDAVENDMGLRTS